MRDAIIEIAAMNDQPADVDEARASADRFAHRNHARRVGDLHHLGTRQDERMPGVTLHRFGFACE